MGLGGRAAPSIPYAAYRRKECRGVEALLVTIIEKQRQQMPLFRIFRDALHQRLKTLHAFTFQPVELPETGFEEGRNPPYRPHGRLLRP